MVFPEKNTFFAFILHAHSHAFFMHDNAVFLHKSFRHFPSTFPYYGYRDGSLEKRPLENDKNWAWAVLLVQRIKLYASFPENQWSNTSVRDSGWQLASTHLDSQFGRLLSASSTTKIAFNPMPIKSQFAPFVEVFFLSACMLSVKGEAQGQTAHTKDILHTCTVYFQRKM